MGPVLSILAAISVVLGLVALFRPIAKLRLTTRGRALTLVGVGVVVLLVAGKPPPPDGVDGQGGPNAGQQAGAGGPGGPGTNGGKRPQRQTRQEMPLVPTEFSAKQLRFLASLEDARTAAVETPNPQGQAAIAAQRRDAICALIKDAAVSKWVGRIKGMSSDQQGRGMLAVDIGNKVLLTTAVDPKTEAEADTLVARKSPLYTEVSRFKTGDLVMVSGEFAAGDGTCVKDVGSLTDPAFLFKFTSLTRYF